MTNSTQTMTEELAIPQTEAIVPVSEETASPTLVAASAITNARDAMPSNITEHRTVELLRESVDVRKITRQVGEVRITKRVVEETIQVPVTIRREVLDVERKDVSIPLDENAFGTTQVFGADQTLTFVLHEEVPLVTKSTRAYSQVEVLKHLVTEEKTLTDTIRREEADVTAPDSVRILQDEARSE